MDREKVTKPTAQIGFIKFVLTPMFESVAKVSSAAAAQKLSTDMAIIIVKLSSLCTVTRKAAFDRG